MSREADMDHYEQACPGCGRKTIHGTQQLSCEGEWTERCDAHQCSECGTYQPCSGVVLSWRCYRCKTTWETHTLDGVVARRIEGLAPV